MNTPQNLNFCPRCNRVVTEEESSRGYHDAKTGCGWVLVEKPLDGRTPADILAGYMAFGNQEYHQRYMDGLSRDDLHKLIYELGRVHLEDLRRVADGLR